VIDQPLISMLRNTPQNMRQKTMVSRSAGQYSNALQAYGARKGSPILYAYAGGKNVAHRITLAAPHSTAQTTYALPHRGRSMSRAATDQYVLGSAASNRSAICVCAFVSKVTLSIVACTACAVVVAGLRPPDFPLISEDMWDTL
jgi:hypothetical protein